MKKNLLIAALTLVAAASCQKNNPSSSPLETSTGELIVELGDAPATKVSSAAMQESQINTVQLFVFSEADGKLETDVYKTGSETTHSITTSTGKKMIYAIVNAPRLKHTSISSLEGDLSNLSDNHVAGSGTQSSLVMSGKASANVTSGATPYTCTVNVKKLASAIELTGVTTKFTGTSLEGASFKIKEIYVKNVVGKAPYGMQSKEDKDHNIMTGLPMVLKDADRNNVANWYNKLVLDAKPLPVTYDLCNLTLPQDVKRTLYVYPNSVTTDSNKTTFDPRPTRLVIHALIKPSAEHYENPFDEKDFYYTFDLPALEGNKKYKVNVEISMLGKTDDTDDTKTSAGSAKPTINVLDWDETIELNYQY